MTYQSFNFDFYLTKQYGQAKGYKRRQAKAT